jgi:type IV secretory pathway VirB4 component
MAKTPSQQFLEVEDIREGVLILRDKSLHSILLVSSLNFDLKSEEEQQAIIYQFQNFLNSLDFSVQILVQSRRLNITGYLEKLKELEFSQVSDLLREQTREYRNFIQSLVGSGEIYSKNFFVVVPFYLQEIAPTKKEQFWTKERFERAKIQLLQRVEFVALGLRRCGLQCAMLGTPEIIELLWALHHPQEAEVGFFPEIPPEFIK